MAEFTQTTTYTIHCPKCDSSHVMKMGIRNGQQRYISAVVGCCSYQADPFSASDHVEILTPRFSMNAHVAMFLTTVLNLEQYRYNYGRKCSQTRKYVSRKSSCP